MPRRGRYERHAPLPDARYNSVLVTKFINKLMERGKKGLGVHVCSDEELASHLQNVKEAKDHLRDYTKKFRPEAAPELPKLNPAPEERRGPGSERTPSERRSGPERRAR